jgi:hypothetical protein
MGYSVTGDDRRNSQGGRGAFPSGVGTLRNLRATADGNLLVHQTSINRIGLVTINRSTTTSSR